MRALIFILIFTLGCFCKGQLLQTSSDSTQQGLGWKQLIVPVGLIGTALLLNNSEFEKKAQSRLGGSSSTTIDDYSRFAPVAQMYIADIAGVPSQNHWFDQTKNLGVSLLLTDLITTKLKKNIDKDRPSGDNSNSFPSAHSAYAFTTATVLYEEFKESSPLLAYSGYGFAVATASSCGKGCPLCI